RLDGNVQTQRAWFPAFARVKIIMMSIQSMRMARPSVVSANLLVCIAVLIAVAAFGGGLLSLVERWSRQEEYSHGFLIPFVVAWMLWSLRDALIAIVGEPSWRGPTDIFGRAV